MLRHVAMRFSNASKTTVLVNSGTSNEMTHVPSLGVPMLRNERIQYLMLELLKPISKNTYLYTSSFFCRDGVNTERISLARVKMNTKLQRHSPWYVFLLVMKICNSIKIHHKACHFRCAGVPLLCLRINWRMSSCKSARTTSLLPEVSS